MRGKRLDVGAWTAADHGPLLNKSTAPLKTGWALVYQRGRAVTGTQPKHFAYTFDNKPFSPGPYAPVPPAVNFNSAAGINTIRSAGGGLRLVTLPSVAGPAQHRAGHHGRVGWPVLQPALALGPRRQRGVIVRDIACYTATGHGSQNTGLIDQPTPRRTSGRDVTTRARESEAAVHTRTSTDSVLFSTYNMLDLFADGSAAGREHYRLAVASARALDTDVLAVQEVRAEDQKTAQARLRELADDLGLSCAVPASGGGPARTALAMGGRGYHVGLLWRPGIEPVPGSLRVYGAGEFWHSLSYVTLDVGGTKVRHASFHATPFVRRVRADQNERLLAALRNAAWRRAGGRGRGLEHRKRRPGVRRSQPAVAPRMSRGTHMPPSAGSMSWSTSASGTTTNTGSGGTGPTGGQGMCSGPAACMTRRRCCARPGSRRPGITRPTGMARTGSGGASTRSG